MKEFGLFSHLSLITLAIKLIKGRIYHTHTWIVTYLCQKIIQNLSKLRSVEDI